MFFFYDARRIFFCFNSELLSSPVGFCLRLFFTTRVVDFVKEFKVLFSSWFFFSFNDGIFISSLSSIALFSSLSFPFDVDFFFSSSTSCLLQCVSWILLKNLECFFRHDFSFRLTVESPFYLCH
jgi:hypothetical protein